MKNFPGISDAPGFDEPLEMLLACHGRIASQCATLEKLAQHLPEHGCDQQARQAAQAVMRYFDTAGRHHHADEEQDVFPVLWASGDAEAQRLIAQLLEQHVGLDAAWDALRPGLEAVLSGSSRVLAVPQFVSAYRAHIATENASLLPMARRLLMPPQLEVMGRSMAARRGARFAGAAARDNSGTA